MSTIDKMENSSRTVLCCQQCREENLPQWNYCARCGTALWELCLRCGEPCAAGESYCGTCGACLNDAVAEQVARMDADFLAAAEMASAFHFGEAIALLSPIAKNEHPRLAEQAARANKLIGQLSAKCQRHRMTAEEACQRARQFLAVFDYDGAAEVIENVPLPLQNDDVQQLRSHIVERRREIGAITEELHDAVHHKRLLEMPPRIERLLALKPDHAYAKSLGGQVRKRLMAAAKKMLAEHRYGQALHFMDQISATADIADFQHIRRQTAELDWLARDLRNAPVINPTLVSVAKRLRQLAPDDARSVQLCDALQHRIRLAKNEQSREPLPWARPPETTPLGVPVEWLTGFRRVGLSETADGSELLRHPGRFAIACGLALAGIKQASLQINLLANKQQSVLHRLTHAIRSRSATSAWGIDLGQSGLKAVKLAWDETRQQAAIEAAICIEHSKPLSHAANPSEETSVLSETLKTFLQGQQLKADRVCVSLPGRMALIRQIQTPPVDLAKAKSLVQFEAAHQFAFPLEKLDWDYQLLDNTTDLNDATATANEKARRVVLIAAKRTTTQHFVDAFKCVNLRVDMLQPDFVALHNFLGYDYLAAPGDSSLGKASPVVAVLDIGCDVTNIVVSSPQSMWYRSCGVAGHSFTRALVKQFNLTFAQAEQQKRTPESAERLYDLYEALSPVFDDLLEEVKQSLAAYAEAQPSSPIQQIVAIGGGFLLHGLFRHLRCGR